MGYIIDLSEYQERHNGPSLIVVMQAPSTYTTQAGGTHCAHPKTWGVLVPLLADEFDPNLELGDLWFDTDIQCSEFCAVQYMERVPQLRKLLERSGLGGILEPVEDKALFMMVFREWGEAWLPVRIKDDLSDELNSTALQVLKGSCAILTYQNSD